MLHILLATFLNTENVLRPDVENNMSHQRTIRSSRRLPGMLLLLPQELRLHVEVVQQSVPCNREICVKEYPKVLCVLVNTLYTIQATYFGTKI
jgi:hypothetical protein